MLKKLPHEADGPLLPADVQGKLERIIEDTQKTIPQKKLCPDNQIDVKHKSITLANKTLGQLSRVQRGSAALERFLKAFSDYRARARSLDQEEFLAEIGQQQEEEKRALHHVAKQQQEGELHHTAAQRLYDMMAQTLFRALSDRLGERIIQDSRCMRYSLSLNALFRHLVRPLRSPLIPSGKIDLYPNNRLRSKAIGLLSGLLSGHGLLSGQTNIEADQEMKAMLEEFHSAWPMAGILLPNRETSKSQSEMHTSHAAANSMRSAGALLFSEKKAMPSPKETVPSRFMPPRL